MKRYGLALLLTWLFTGCSGTKVFMGDYDLAKITVSHKQAKIVVENLPYKSGIVDGKLEKETDDDFAFVLSSELNGKFLISRRRSLLKIFHINQALLMESWKKKQTMISHLCCLVS